MPFEAARIQSPCRLSIAWTNGGISVGILNERLDDLRNYIQRRDFLEGKGLSNEVNIHMFCYDAKEEMTVLHYIELIKTDQMLKCHLIECNLYEIFLCICEDFDISNAVPNMEKEDGGAFLLNQLHSAIGTAEFVNKIKEMGPFSSGDVLLITGVGDAFPFMRVHKMLDALQPHFPNNPILVIYPGKYDGTSMKLFSRLEPNAYYRAFNVFKGVVS